MVSATTRDFLTTTDICRRYHVTESTVVRWMRRGVPGNGQRVFLEYLKVGGRYRVKPQALDEFIRLTSSPAAVEAERQRENAVAAQQASERIKRRVGLK